MQNGGGKKKTNTYLAKPKQQEKEIPTCQCASLAHI